MPLLSDVREALVNRLSPLRDGGVLVRGLPNRPKEYGQLNGAAQVLCFWKEDRPEAPELTDEMFQRIQQDWVFEIRSPSTREADGLEALVEAVNTLILGFAPPNCEKASLKAREFLGQLEHYWLAEATYTVPSYLMEGREVEISTLLSAIQINDEFGG